MAQKGRLQPLWWAMAAILLVTAARTAGVLVSPLHLGPDEAQYWRWAQEPALGYYSKPPLIAWVIAIETAIFGDGEWAVRIAAPWLHAAAAAGVLALGQAMYSSRAGAFAALVYLLMPGVSVSSHLMTTDALLLPLWSLALLCLWKVREGGGLPPALGLGAAVGCGLLAKYAMVYFLIGLALVCLIDRPTWRALAGRRGAAAGGLATALVLPHLIWSAFTGFATVGHTVDNADWGAGGPDPFRLFDFLIDQMGVFGPIAFLAFGVGLMVSLRRNVRVRDVWLLCFALPVLMIIAGQAVIARAHANWAAVAYPAASVLVAEWLLRAPARQAPWLGLAGLAIAGSLALPGDDPFSKLTIGVAGAAAVLAVGAVATGRPIGLLWLSLGVNAAAALLFLAFAAGPAFLAEAFGRTNDFKRLRGWELTADAVFDRAEAVGATAIMVDEREVWHGLDYYGRDRSRPPLYAWRLGAGPKSFAEAEPLAPPNDARVLIVSVKRMFRPRIRGDFKTIDRAGEIEIPIGGPHTRRLKLYLASGFDPLERTLEWEARFRGLAED